MNNYARDELLQELLDLVEHSTEEVHPKTRPFLSFELSHNDPPLTLTGAHAEQFDTVAARLLHEQDWSERFSEQFIRSKLGLLLLWARRAGIDRAASLLDDLLAYLADYSLECTVFVPVVGILWYGKSLKLGNVELRMMDDGVLSEVRAALEIIHAEDGTEAERREWIDLRVEELSRDFGGTVCAEYRVIAEPDRAIERAQLETRRALELLNFALPALWPNYPNGDTVVGLAGETVRPSTKALLLSKEHSIESHRSPFRVAQLQVMPSNLRRMEEVGVFTLSSLLAMSDRQRSNYDRALLDAVHWFAISQTQVEAENRLVNLITSLEVLLNTPSKSGSITAVVARGTAIIAADHYEERKSIKDFVTRMYGCRSAVAHGGRKTLLESDITRLRDIAVCLIRRLIRRRDEFTSLSQLEAWIERVQLGGVSTSEAGESARDGAVVKPHDEERSPRQ